MPDEQPPQDGSTGEDDDESLTTSTKTRWEYLGSVMAFITVVSFIVFFALGILGVATLSVPGQWFYVLALLVLTAGGWTFGSDLLEAYRKK